MGVGAALIAWRPISLPERRQRGRPTYQQPSVAGVVAARLREAVGAAAAHQDWPHDRRSAPSDLSKAVAPHADALVMVNCIAAVLDAQQRPLFDGQNGIAGDAIREASITQVHLFARVIRQHALKLRLVGVGGIATARHVHAYQEAGSHAVQLATAAMLNPLLGKQMRRDLGSTSEEGSIPS